MVNGTTAKTYPSERQYQEWKEAAKRNGMSVSEWIQAMVEAGRKPFTVDVDADRTRKHLRQQLDDRENELERARRRVQKLERQQRQSEIAAIREYVKRNPGCHYEDIQRHIIDSSAQRTTDHIESMRGEDIRKEDDGYYPADE